MNIEPGARFDSYEIVAQLGAGGMGEVWLARDLHLDRKAAIKVLPSHLTGDADRVARFRQEARAASALNSPNVCTIYALGTTDDGRVFIAMEYIEGRTLRDRMAGRPLSMREAIEIATQIASGLAAAHGAGVIHRDIKPENVMIRSDGLVKVLDFGLAKLVPPIVPFDGERSTRTALRTDGSVAGTMAYMSPEQASGKTLDARTDIFSLGTVLYEMVTGRQPFLGNSPAVVLDGILNRTPTSPSYLNPDVSTRLEDIVIKTLEKDSDLRYQTASELRTDLFRLKRDSGVPAAGAGRTSDTALRTRGRIPAIVVALGLLLTALVGLAVMRWDGVRVLLFRPELQEVQLTTNSSENPVSAAAISPDGKYLAYADETGLHLRLIDKGDTHTIAAPEIGYINTVWWFPDGTKLILSGTPTAKDGEPAIWSLSVIGGRPQRLRDNGIEASVSPDGSQIAFVDAERTHVWLMGTNGEEPHPVATAGSGDTFYVTKFFASRLGYGRLRTIADKSGHMGQDVSLEVRDPEGHTYVLISDPGLRGVVDLPDGRWLYSLVASVYNVNASLWEAQADPQASSLRARRHLRDWPGMMSWKFSASADGKRVVFLKQRVQKDVYVADLTPDGTPVNPRRLTLDDSTDFATNWTADGKAILFSSNRNGTFDIFRQALDQRVPDAIASGPDDETGPTAVTPDGGSFYYLVAPKGGSAQSVWQTRAAGGPHEKVADESQVRWTLCPRSTSAGCVLVEQNAKELVIYEIDPVRGKGRIIARSNAVAGPFPVAFSHDGSHVAILMTKDRRIRVLSLHDEPPRDVAIAGVSLDSNAFYWLADDSGWYVSSTSIPNVAGTDLLRIGLDGAVKVVWHQNVSDTMSGIPSPDGRHIALTAASTVSNAWMLTNF